MGRTTERTEGEEEGVVENRRDLRDGGRRSWKVAGGVVGSGGDAQSPVDDDESAQQSQLSPPAEEGEADDDDEKLEGQPARVSDGETIVEAGESGSTIGADRRRVK
jgi:hypothetical protein